MVYKVDNEYTVLPKIELKPIEPQPEPLPLVQPDPTAKKNENSFLGNLFKNRLFSQFENGGGNNSTVLASLTFDKNQEVSVDKFGQRIYQYDSSMSGTDAAKAVVSQEGDSYSYETQGKFYLDAVKDHKNDPAWMAEFFKGLGPDRTAKLIGDTLTPGVFQYSTPEEVRESLANIRESIANLAMANPPVFDQSDMDALVKSMASDSRGFYDLIALEVFGKMDYKAESVKNMFFQSASKLALSGELDEGKSKQLAAAAAHVLANTSANNQAEQLSKLRGNAPAGTTSDLNKFITLAMNGPTQTPSLESRLGTLSQYPGEHGPATSEPFGKVDALIFNAAYVGYTDGHTPGPKLSSAELSALRTELFNTATANLTNPSIEAAYNNDFMKDGLSEIFMQDFNAIYKSGIGENGSGINSTFSKGLAEFFKFAVFTTDPGVLQKSVMNFVKDKVQDISKSLGSTSPNAEKEFMEKFGMTRYDGAALLGNLLGTMKLGLNAHIADITKDADAKKEMLGFLFDCTVGLIPGAGGKLSEGATQIAYKLLGQILDKSQSKIIDAIKTGALDQAKQYFVESNTAKDPQELLENLKNGVNAMLPDGDNGFGLYHQTFQSAYNYTINN